MEMVVENVAFGTILEVVAFVVVKLAASAAVVVTVVVMVSLVAVIVDREGHSVFAMQLPLSFLT